MSGPWSEPDQTVPGPGAGHKRHHLLEHLSDDEIGTALGNMLRAGCRLVVAVPYEDTVQHVYGHEQLFDRGKLASWGEWCARRMGGRYWCEDVSGGLLVVDRPRD